MSTALTAAERVAIARHPQRPNITDYIQALFTDFFEQKATASAARMPRSWAAWPCTTAAL